MQTEESNIRTLDSESILTLSTAQSRSHHMNEKPKLDSIAESLGSALEQLRATAWYRTTTPGRGIRFGEMSDILLKRYDDFLESVPALRDIRDWAGTYWHPDRHTGTVPGTITLERGELANYGGQPDAQTASCSILAAAFYYGIDEVVDCAVRFALHGAIEKRSYHFFRGSSVPARMELDPYCALLPYSQALDIVRDNLLVRMTLDDLGWPPGDMENVCALEIKSFWSEPSSAGEFAIQGSPLVRAGKEPLQMILGLVWGKGLREFANYEGSSRAVAMMTPIPGFGGGSASVRQVMLPSLHSPTTSAPRPVNNGEVAQLIDGYTGLPERLRQKLDLAMRRLRDSTERIHPADKVIDLSIALEALFSDGSDGIERTVSTRGAWYFSDSSQERNRIEATLKEFYRDRSHIVHGNISRTPSRRLRREEHRQTLIADADNVVRASIKETILAGGVPNWRDSETPGVIWRDPPRMEAEIPSVKSDSLSWSIEDLEMIDQALEAVWRPEINDAPDPAPGSTSNIYQGLDRGQMFEYERQGTSYIIKAPVLLYMAHPKWNESDGPIDDRKKHYCERDVERHLRLWDEAAHEKRLDRFQLALESVDNYLPERFDWWRHFLGRSGYVWPEPSEQ